MEIRLFELGDFELLENHAKESYVGFKSKRGDGGTAFQQFEFDSSLLRMSLATSSWTTQLHIYTKGSP